LRQRIARARRTLGKVRMEHTLLRRVAELCLLLKIDGHRGELTITRAARALAAFEGKSAVTTDELRRVAVMSLRHRLRKDPLESMDSGLRIEQAFAKVFDHAARK